MRLPAEVTITDADRAFAERLMAARIQAKYLPRQLDRAAHLSTGTVSVLENVLRPASGAEVAALAGALGLSPGELTGLVIA